MLALLCLVGVTVWAVRERASAPANPVETRVEPVRQARNPPTRIESRQVPLPPGDWRMLARIPAEGEESQAPQASMVLVRLNGRDVDAAVLVQVNRLGHRVHWGLPPACARDDFIPRRVLYASDHDGSCAYAAFADGTGPLTGVPIDPAWQRAMREAVDRGWNVPATWLAVVFRKTDPEDALQIRYLFHPWPIEQSQPPISAAWRRIQADRLALWIEATAPRVSAAFRDRLRSGLEATLGDPEQPPSKDDDPPKDRDAAAPDEASRTGTARAMSYRMFASMADVGVLWLYLGNAVTASTLATLEFAAQGATSATHEYVWSLLAPSLAQNDLPGVGVETPLPR